MDLLLSIVMDMQPGRLAESLIFLGVLWWKFKPHLTKIEDRMHGMEKAMQNISTSMLEGFAKGDKRFGELENRVTNLETNQKGE